MHLHLEIIDDLLSHKEDSDAEVTLPSHSVVVYGIPSFPQEHWQRRTQGCPERLRVSCCCQTVASETRFLYSHTWGIYSRSPGSVAEPLVSETPECK